jgi:hypothetical protein
MGSDDLPVEFEADAAYVLNGEHVCHECGAVTQVFGLMLVGPFRGTTAVLGPEDEDEAPLLRRAKEIPNTLAAVITERSSGHFRIDFSNTVGERYWMNHCEACDAKIGDWFVHKPGEAFFPTNDAEMAKVSGVYVAGPWIFHEPDFSVSSWTTAWVQRKGQEN